MFNLKLLNHLKCRKEISSLNVIIKKVFKINKIIQKNVFMLLNYSLLNRLNIEFDVNIF